MYSVISPATDVQDPQQLDLFTVKDTRDSDENLPCSTHQVVTPCARDPAARSELNASQKLLAEILYRKSRELASKPKPNQDDEDRS